MPVATCCSTATSFGTGAWADAVHCELAAYNCEKSDGRGRRDCR